MKYLKYYFAAICVFLVSCGNSDVYERISSAEMAYATEDAASARRICDEILNDDGESNSLTASQYGRMSILYMQLYDRTDDADALEMATRCYRSAYKVNPDSASNFYRNLPVKQVHYGMSLSSIVESTDNPTDISDFEDHSSLEDSISRVDD